MSKIEVSSEYINQEMPEKLRPTSEIIRMLAEPDPDDPTVMRYPKDMDLVIKMHGNVTNSELRSTYKSRINDARRRFTERIVQPETIRAVTMKEHQRDMEYIRNLYPTRSLSDDDIVRLVMRPDGNKTYITKVGKTNPFSSQTVIPHKEEAKQDLEEEQPNNQTSGDHSYNMKEFLENLRQARMEKQRPKFGSGPARNVNADSSIDNKEREEIVYRP